MPNGHTNASPSGCHYSCYKVIIPSRWHMALDVMLEKNPGDPKINQLHVMMIGEGNINAIMKFGSHECRTAPNTLLLKITAMDTIQLFHLNSALITSNEVACYDQITTEYTAVAYRV
eukprot:9732984-Ditylum_brightwellii.AAC.1